MREELKTHPLTMASFAMSPSVGSGAFLPRLPLPCDCPENPIGISDMADAFGVTHRTLHFYEEKGLLAAQRMGPMRVYGPEDMRRMAIINACREIDMPIADIQDLMEALAQALSASDAARLFEAALQGRRRELAAQQSNLRRQMQRIGELLESATEGNADAAAPPPPLHLSPIETKCLALMAEGHPATRIARLMDMDMTGVLTLESDIIRKFNGHNRFQAVAKAVLLGHVSTE